MSCSSVIFIGFVFLCFFSFHPSVRMAKGDPKKPKGKMSAYAFFVQTCREEHKKKNPEGPVNFAEFSKKCSERWKVFLFVSFKLLLVGFHTLVLFTLRVAPGGCFLPLHLGTSCMFLEFCICVFIF